MAVEKISVIIPVLNEEGIIQKTLLRIRDGSDVETIIVDGGSVDQTVELAQNLGVKVICCARIGRAGQMNAGAAAATGEILLFLHADTRLPVGYEGMIREALSKPRTIAGAFKLGIEGKGRLLRLVEIMVNARSRFLGIPYGDQAIFLKAPTFREIGGFPNLPVMEDFEIMRQLRKRGGITIARAAVLTSGRRWQKLGVFKTTLINQMIILGYLLGVSPVKLVSWYRRQR